MDIEEVISICRSFPAVSEDIKWDNDLVFSVGGKMFCVIGLDQNPTSASFKVSDEDFDEMASRPGFKPAPYLAKSKWVWMDDINRLKKPEWEKNLQQSYELVKARLTKKTRIELGLN